MPDAFEILKERSIKLWSDKGLLNESVRIKTRPLSPEEAIGNPEADDFPLQKGRERLIQAEFRGSPGQAFTDRYGDFEGSLEEVASTASKNNFRRAVFVAALNAVLRHLGQAEKTIHCKDKGPNQCARELTSYISERFGTVKITQAGFQPRMIESLAPNFPLRVLDLDSDNIGSQKFGVTIEGPEDTKDAIRWADLLFVTGTTLANGSIDRFLTDKPVLFYGTTIAGAASLMGWDRFCPP
ncbi:MAG: hypothetical protein JRJ73_11860 [Deltaproteobacteria bacterium]|nr:hypothetical protein [Deltaproteobacteria bacterium]